MKGKAVFILLVLSLFLLSCIFVACTKKPQEEPFKKAETKATTPPPPQPSPAELAKKAIEPFVKMLAAAQILEEPGKPDDPKYAAPQYKSMLAIKDKIAAGSTIEQLRADKTLGAIIEGPFPNIKPADIHPNLVKLLEGVEPGKTSKILFAEGQGYAMVFLKSKDAATGNVEVAVILIPQTTTAPAPKPPEQATGSRKPGTGQPGPSQPPPPKPGGGK